MTTLNDRQAVALEKLRDAQEMLSDAIQTLWEAGALLEEGLKEQLRRGVIADLEMVLDNQHSWMGRNLITLADVIDLVEDPEREGS